MRACAANQIKDAEKEKREAKGLQPESFPKQDAETGSANMPNYQSILQAREKARRIREVHFSFKRERAKHKESQSDIRRALQSISASEFLAEVRAND